MLFVVDANVVISALIRKGVPFSVFLLNSFLKKFKFIAPEFLLEEVKNHEDKILKYSTLSKDEFDEIYNFLLAEITFIPADEFLDFLPKAKKIAPHLKDAPYIALSLASNCPIFSGDKGLKDSRITVISPREILNRLLNLE